MLFQILTLLAATLPLAYTGISIHKGEGYDFAGYDQYGYNRKGLNVYGETLAEVQEIIKDMSPEEVKDLYKKKSAELMKEQMRYDYEMMLKKLAEKIAQWKVDMADLEAREYELFLDHQEAEQRAEAISTVDRSKMTVRDKQVERQIFRKFDLRDRQNQERRTYLENNNPDPDYGLDPNSFYVDEAFQAG